jgi:hypothetical protein
VGNRQDHLAVSTFLRTDMALFSPVQILGLNTSLNRSLVSLQPSLSAQSLETTPSESAASVEKAAKETPSQSSKKRKASQVRLEDAQPKLHKPLEQIPYMDIGVNGDNHWSLLEALTHTKPPTVVFFDLVTGSGTAAAARGSKVTVVYNGTLLDLSTWGRSTITEPTIWTIGEKSPPVVPGTHSVLVSIISH